MRRVFVLAAMLLGSTSAHAGVAPFRCYIYNQHNDLITWEFTDDVQSDSQKLFRQTAYQKNGVDLPFPSEEFWAVTFNAATFTVSMRYRADSRYSISYFNHKSVDAGNAAMFFNDTVIGKGKCGRSSSAPPAPAPTESASAGSSGSGADSVPFTMVHNAIYIHVTVGDTYTTMVLDTGANVSTINPELANSLIANGQATEGEPIMVTMADDSKHYERTVFVKRLIIGQHTRYNVLMTVSDGDMLLGLPVLKAIGRFTIDADKGELVFG
jgi:predicted aspartyl protease